MKEAASSTAAPGAAQRVNMRRVSRVPILCYHNVDRRPAGTKFGLLYVEPAQFDRQLWAIERLGMRGVSMGEGLAGLRGTTRSRMVALTFDDGYVDTLTVAAPILARYGFRATCYIVTNALGAHNRWDDDRIREKKSLMTREQVGQWLNAGMEIASHSCSHPALERIDDTEAAREISDSRADLRRLFGVTPDHFAYPFGGFTPRTVSLVRRAGYRSAVTTQPGIARGTDDMYRLPRLLVDGDRGLGRFLLRVGTPYEDLRQGRGLFPT
jgi:peptidoglycan/xylan/chitin deacetylase (PgdA/CDA1 family)